MELIFYDRIWIAEALKCYLRRSRLCRSQIGYPYITRRLNSGNNKTRRAGASRTNKVIHYRANLAQLIVNIGVPGSKKKTCGKRGALEAVLCSFGIGDCPWQPCYPKKDCPYNNYLRIPNCVDERCAVPRERTYWQRKGRPFCSARSITVAWKFETWQAPFQKFYRRAEKRLYF